MSCVLINQYSTGLLVSYSRKNPIVWIFKWPCVCVCVHVCVHVCVLVCVHVCVHVCVQNFSSTVLSTRWFLKTFFVLAKVKIKEKPKHSLTQFNRAKMTQKNLFVGDKKCWDTFPEWNNTKIFLEILSVDHYSRCYDIQLNDIYYNDTEYNNRNMTHSITTLNITTLNAKCCILLLCCTSLC